MIPLRANGDRSVRFPAVLLVLFFVLFAGAPCALAQKPLMHFERLPDTEDRDLPNTLYDLYQDTAGYVWSACLRTTMKYDGNETLLTPVCFVDDPHTVNIQESGSGKILFSTYFGNIYIQDGDSVIPYPYNDTLAALNDRMRQFHMDAQGTLHLGNGIEGYMTIDNNGVKSEIITNETHSQGSYIKIFSDSATLPFRVGSDSLDSIFILDEHNTILTRAKFEPWKDASPLHIPRPRGLVLRNGSLLVAKNNLLAIMDDQGIVIQKELKTSVFEMMEDSDGGIWVGCRLGGVYYWPNQALRDEDLQILFEGSTSAARFEDRENGIWISRNNFGVYHIPDRWYRKYRATQPPFSASRFTEIFPMKDHLLALLGNGQLRRVYNDSVATVDMGGKVGIAFEDTVNVKIWIAHKDTVWSYYNNTLHKIVLDNPGVPLHFFHWPDGNGVGLWSPRHIHHLKDDAYQGTWAAPERIYRCVPGDSGTVWFACETGLYKIFQDSLMPIENELVQQRIIGVGWNNGRLWISTETDLMVMEGDSITTLVPPDDNHLGVTRKFAWHNDTAYFLCHAGFVKVWLNPPGDSLPATIVRLPMRSEFQIMANYISIVGNKVYLNGQKYLWITDLEQLNRFKPSLMETFIRGVKIKGKDTALADHFDLDYDQRFIQFRYASVGFRNGNRKEYQTRLFGLDSAWQASKSSTIQYTNLDPGTYRFEVRSRGSYPPIYGPTVAITFVVAPPFWQTWWFRTLFIGGLAGLIYLVFRYRIGLVRRRARMERALDQSRHQALSARMSPHFLFNALNSIQLFVAQNDEASSSRYVSRFARLMRQILEHSGQLTIPLEEELDAIRNYLELEKMRLKGQMKYVIELEDGLDAKRIRIPTMLIQPHVENAVWHGIRHRRDGAGKITLRITSADNQLICQVEDNGIGIGASVAMKTDPKHRSMGSTITENRMRLINSIFKINLNYSILDLGKKGTNEQGTRVEILFPLTFNNRTAKI